MLSSRGETLSAISPSQVQKAEGAFASPIEVQNTVEFSLPAPTPESLALPVSQPVVASEALPLHL